MAAFSDAVVPCSGDRASRFALIEINAATGKRPMSDNDILRGRLAVITGGSSGIGAATARRLADAGADVIIGYHHNEDRAEALRSHLPRGLHEIARLSLADPESFKALSAHIASTRGKLDIL